ncbi:glucose uptake inhibitor SgrT [Escherichia coli]|nr:glucose uptake inhibitor SgrT [Escherichia sp. 93.0816]EFB2827470.1 glucose uptake inhibitor SgrT [Escherichia coli]
MRQFYRHYFIVTEKMCWLRGLSVLQRLVMPEERIPWEGSYFDY